MRRRVRPCRVTCRASSRHSTLTADGAECSSTALTDRRPLPDGTPASERALTSAKESIPTSSPRRVKPDEVSHPREDRDVGDRIVAPGRLTTHDREVLVQRIQDAPRLGHVAVARALVFVVFAAEPVEETDLPEHRSEAADLKHQPLQRLVALGALVARQEACRSCRRDRPRSRPTRKRERLAAGAVLYLRIAGICRTD